ncbi:MAG: hypothetical protein V7689_02610 [Psychrobacter sp.]
MSDEKEDAGTDFEEKLARIIDQKSRKRNNNDIYERFINRVHGSEENDQAEFETLGRVFNSSDSHLNGLKMAKSCQTSSNSWLISRYYLRYFSCLTAIYLIFTTIFEMKTRPRKCKEPCRFRTLEHRRVATV